MNIELKNKEALYGRSKDVQIAIGICDCCLNEKMCLITDNSGDEYGDIKLCLNCINLNFEKIKLEDK